MQPSYWQRQTKAAPLFPDMIWSRPENRAYAGKLAIVGGNAQSFARAAEAYGFAETAGVGTSRVLLPDVLRKTVSRLFPAAEFAPSTPSGSFASTALGELLPISHWADAVLLAGDLGRNSETAVFLESFVGKYSGQLTITCDAADYFISTPAGLIGRTDTMLVLSFAQLQKLATQAKFTKPFTFDMDFFKLIEYLHNFAQFSGWQIVTKHLDTLFAVAGSQVSTTKLVPDLPTWRLQAAAYAAVWWAQNPAKPYAALSTALTFVA